MKALHIALVALLACSTPGIAFAHGGSFRGPSGGSSGPQVPPGTSDPPTTPTRWETWWAANKDTYLRLNERMRKDTRVVTPGKDGDEARKTAQELRAERDKRVRDRLVPIFIEALGDDSFEVRTAAAIALGKTGDRRGSKPLRHASLKDAHKDVRDAAVLGLGLLGHDENIPFLEAMLSDFEENTRRRSFAAFALGLIGGEDASSTLERYITGRGPRPVAKRDNQPPLVASVFVALGLAGRPEVAPILRDALGDKRHDPNVQSFILLSLGRLQDRPSLDTTVRLLDSKETYVRRSAAIAVGKIGTPKDTPAVQRLFRSLRGDRDPITRHFAAVSLSGIADAATRKKLVATFPKSDGVDRPFVALALGLGKLTEAAPMLRKALPRERDPSIRASLCLSLALMDDKAAVPVIETQLAGRGDIWLRGYAALSLGMLASHSSAPLLRERLKDETDSRLRMNVAVALGLLHDPSARNYLTDLMRSGDGTIYERGGAAMSMGVLRLNASVPDLLAVYGDAKEQELVRAFAMVALGLLGDPSPVPKLARFAIDNNYSVSVDPLNEVLSIL